MGVGSGVDCVRSWDLVHVGDRVKPTILDITGAGLQELKSQEQAPFAF